MLKIGLTGNIASGKSLFESYLKELGFKVLCLDEVTKNLYQNSLPLQKFLLETFNTTDKKEVSKIVFSNPDLKKKLENFIYPLILDEMNNFFIENPDNILFVSAALLFESDFDKYFDKIVLVTSPIETRIERLMQRNGYTRDEALLRINSQMSDTEKTKNCDFVIENNSTPEALKQKAHDFVLKIAPSNFP